MSDETTNEHNNPETPASNYEEAYKRLFSEHLQMLQDEGVKNEEGFSLVDKARERMSLVLQGISQEEVKSLDDMLLEEKKNQELFEKKQEVERKRAELKGDYNTYESTLKSQIESFGEEFENIEVEEGESYLEKVDEKLKEKDEKLKVEGKLLEGEVLQVENINKFQKILSEENMVDKTSELTTILEKVEDEDIKSNCQSIIDTLNAMKVEDADIDSLKSELEGKILTLNTSFIDLSSSIESKTSEYEESQTEYDKNFASFDLIRADGEEILNKIKTLESENETILSSDINEETLKAHRAGISAIVGNMKSTFEKVQKNEENLTPAIDKMYQADGANTKYVDHILDNLNWVGNLKSNKDTKGLKDAAVGEMTATIDTYFEGMDISEKDKKKFAGDIVKRYEYQVNEYILQKTENQYKEIKATKKNPKLRQLLSIAGGMATLGGFSIAKKIKGNIDKNKLGKKLREDMKSGGDLDFGGFAKSAILIKKKELDLVKQNELLTKDDVILKALASSLQSEGGIDESTATEMATNIMNSTTALEKMHEDSVEGLYSTKDRNINHVRAMNVAKVIGGTALSTLSFAGRASGFSPLRIAGITPEEKKGALENTDEYISKALAEDDPETLCMNLATITALFTDKKMKQSKDPAVQMSLSKLIVAKGLLQARHDRFIVGIKEFEIAIDAKLKGEKKKDARRKRFAIMKQLTLTVGFVGVVGIVSSFAKGHFDISELIDKDNIAEVLKKLHDNPID